MSIKKLFNTDYSDYSGCFIIIVLFVTIPSLFINFKQCERGKDYERLQETVEIQHDSIIYLNRLCEIDTAQVNSTIKEIKMSLILSMGASLEINDIAEEMDCTEAAEQIIGFANSAYDEACSADSLFNKLNLTIRKKLKKKKKHS